MEQLASAPPPDGSIGALLRAFRHRACLSQEQLAARADLSERTMRNLEPGRVRSPRTHTVRLLADALALTGPERQNWVAAAQGANRRQAQAGPPGAGAPAQLLRRVTVAVLTAHSQHAAMPFSPWVDMEVNGESYQANRDKDAFYYQEVVQWLVDTFLGEDGDRRDPLANPLYADLTGLAPMYIQAGDETLLDDSRRLAGHARTAGVEVRLDIFPGQQHTFQMAAGRAPDADDAIHRMAAWVRPKLGL